MKKYILLLAIFVGVANAQFLAVDSSYAAADTTAWVSVAGGNTVLVFQAADSCNVTLYVDYAESIKNTTNYSTYTADDSTVSVNASGYFNGYVLRYNSTNNIPGAGAIRLRVSPITGDGKNGSTSPTYDAWIRPY